ncbi:hypothetical protein F5B19DRAFT_220895 [Rostrohypoxylon terebratum]|nr:hypothetical protein F5B19DRAFT_220895 [Rostrohypoxylon terebratum]
MQFTTFFASALALAGSALAADPTALLHIESSHGGAGNGLRNVTVEVTINKVFNHDSALDEVSSIYLIGTTEGVPIKSVVCYSYKNEDATGDRSTPITAYEPARLSTNTVQVGSIECLDGK